MVSLSKGTTDQIDQDVGFVAEGCTEHPHSQLHEREMQEFLSNVCYLMKAEGMVKSISNLGISYGCKMTVTESVCEKDSCLR